MRALGGVGGIVVQRRALKVEVEILAFEIVFEVVAAGGGPSAVGVRGSVRGGAARAHPHAVHLQGRAGGAGLGRRAGGFPARARWAPADLTAMHAASLATSLRVRVRGGGGARVRVLRRAGDAQTAETHVRVGRAGGFPIGGFPLPAPLVSASGPANAEDAWGGRDGVRRSRGAGGGGEGELDAREEEAGGRRANGRVARQKARSPRAETRDAPGGVTGIDRVSFLAPIEGG